ncbi:MAG: acyltransferase family protein [Lachnospiraceae bacterium]|nr:acyltransferase family protein [Lachnospiraceae bacterium]
MEKKRIDYFDLARGIGIILVIIGHIEYMPIEFHTFVISFHMPLFFVISGMLLFINREAEKELPSFVKKRAHGIMLPYLYFSLIYIVVYVFYYLIKDRTVMWQQARTNLVSSLTLNGISVLWFLPALFISEVVFIFLVKKIKTLAAPAVIVLFIISLILNRALQMNYLAYSTTAPYMLALMILRAFICMFFIGFGYFFFLIREKLLQKPTGDPHKDFWQGSSERISKKEISSAIIDLLIGAALITAVVFFSRINLIIDLRACSFGNPYVYFTTAIFGSLGVIFLMKSTEIIINRKPLFPLKYLGKNSLIIMLTHLDLFVLYVAEVFAMHFNKKISTEYGTAFNIMTVAFVLIAEVFIIEIINRFFPFLVAKKKNPDK